VARSQRAQRVALPQLKAQGDSYWSTRALAISPDGRLLATYEPETLRVIQLWDISALGLRSRGKDVYLHP